MSLLPFFCFYSVFARFCRLYIWIISFTVVESSGLLSCLIQLIILGNRSAYPRSLVLPQVCDGERVISSADTVITYWGCVQTSGVMRESTFLGFFSTFIWSSIFFRFIICSSVIPLPILATVLKVSVSSS